MGRVDGIMWAAAAAASDDDTKVDIAARLMLCIVCMAHIYIRIVGIKCGDD